MFLSDQDLLQLTGKERPRAQQKALNQMGVPFRVRADGHTLVLETSVREHFSSNQVTTKAKVFSMNLANA